MKKKYTDAQSYFQDWAQAKKKEVQDMENPCGKIHYIRKK